MVTTILCIDRDIFMYKYTQTFVFAVFRASPLAFGDSRLGVKSELQLRLVLQPQQHWIFTPLSEARDQTRILREIASGS